jgi:hypothetical protein
VVNESEDKQLRMNYAKLAEASLLKLFSSNEAAVKMYSSDLVTSAQLATLTWSLVKLKVLHVFGPPGKQEEAEDEHSVVETETEKSKKKKKKKKNSKKLFDSSDSSASQRILLCLLQHCLQKKLFNSMQCGLLSWAMALWPAYIKQKFDTPIKSSSGKSSTTKNKDDDDDDDIDETVKFIVNALPGVTFEVAQTASTNVTENKVVLYRNLNARTVANVDFLIRCSPHHVSSSSSPSSKKDGAKTWLQQAAEVSVGQVCSSAQNNENAIQSAWNIVLENSSFKEQLMYFPKLLVVGVNASLSSLLTESLQSDNNNNNNNNNSSNVEICFHHRNTCGDLKGETWFCENTKVISGGGGEGDNTPLYDQAVLRLPSTGDFTAIDFAIASVAVCMAEYGVLWLCGVLSEGLASQRTLDLLTK